MKRPLIKFEQETAEGKAPVSLYFDSQGSSEPAALVSYLLRNRYGRVDLSMALSSNIQDGGFSIGLEKARSEIILGNFEGALETLNQLNPSNLGDQEEISLERARIANFQQNFGEAQGLLNTVVASKATLPATRMTAFQMLGDVELAQGRHSKALEHFETASCIAKLFPLAKSAAAIKAYQVVCYTQLDDEANARRIQMETYHFLNALEKDALYLAHLLYALRAEFYISKKWGTPLESKQILVEARAVARWLHEKITINKCEKDLKDLNCQTAVSAVAEFNNWTYLIARRIILVNDPAKIVEVAPNSLMARFLGALVLKPHLSVEQLFESVWQLPFDKLRHNNIVRVTITNLRKEILSTAIQVINGEVSLS